MSRNHSLPPDAPLTSMAALCRAGHALTLAQVYAGNACPLCVAQATATGPTMAQLAEAATAVLAIQQGLACAWPRR